MLSPPSSSFQAVIGLLTLATVRMCDPHLFTSLPVFAIPDQLKAVILD